MEFEVKQDVAAPIETVFDAITDFPGFERQVLRRGADIRRVDPGGTVGATWDVRFDFRGRERKIRATVVALDAPNTLRARGDSAALGFDVTVDLMALARGQTRMTLLTNVQAKSLTSRLMLQSLRLARGTVMRRLEKRVAQFARDIETRHSRKDNTGWR